MASDSDVPRPKSSRTAKRMRRYRLRKRNGLRCLTIELPEKHIVAFIRWGLLKQHARNDPDAVKQALYVHLARTLE
ncbi:MAG: hypothetical protein P8Y71_28345 [Pseudolabrys sp.]|jgi:hypothetical protein